MADETADNAAPPKTGKKGLLIGVLLAVLLGAGGFYVTWSGLILAPESGEMSQAPAPMPAVGFIAIDPLTISLGPGATGRHLRFRAELEVDPRFAAEVAGMMPRIVDVLNGYLRALDMRDIEDPGALIRLRAQMLRRIQVVTGEGRVNDLLIMEFVLN